VCLRGVPNKEGDRGRDNRDAKKEIEDQRAYSISGKRTRTKAPGIESSERY